MTRTGWFETSNELVNRLHENAVWSMRGNFVGVPTDCPQRDERLGWTGDLNAFAPTAAFLYDVRGVLGSWLDDLAAEQREKGFVPWVVPDVLSTPSSPTALWSDVAVSLPWALYQEYGDLEILRRAYPSMTAFIRSVEPSLDEHGLWSTGFQYGDWLDPDAPADNPAGGKTDRHLVASAYLCKTTRELADTAALLGEHADAAHFTALADRVRAAFRREYVTDAGRIVNESATAYALAIVFDLLEPEQRAARRRPAREARREGGLHHLDRIRRHPARDRRALEHRSPRRGVRAAHGDALPVVPLPRDHGCDHDLGALGLDPARRHHQPLRDDLAQPLRARRGRRLAAPRRRRHRARSSRGTDACGSPRSRAAGSPRRPHGTTRFTARSPSPGASTAPR